MLLQINVWVYGTPKKSLTLVKKLLTELATQWQLSFLHVFFFVIICSFLAPSLQGFGFPSLINIEL
jgi:hypothetical protein